MVPSYDAHGTGDFLLRLISSSIRPFLEGPKLQKPPAYIYTLIKISNSILPPLPAILGGNPLPPEVSAPELLLLKYFPKIGYSLPADQRPSALISFNRTLHVENTLILVTAFSADQHWTSRFLVIPDPTLKFLCDSAPGSCIITLVDGSKKG